MNAKRAARARAIVLATYCRSTTTGRLHSRHETGTDLGPRRDRPHQPCLRIIRCDRCGHVSTQDRSW